MLVTISYKLIEATSENMAPLNKLIKERLCRIYMYIVISDHKENRLYSQRATNQYVVLISSMSIFVGRHHIIYSLNQ